MARKFHAWVPTVSGALSFSTFGDVSHPPRAISVNRADRVDRFLISFRARDSSDIVLPFRSLLGPFFLNLRGRFWFVCIARSTRLAGKDQDVLQGTLFLFHDRRIWREQAQPIVVAAQNLLRQFQYIRDGSIGQYAGAAMADTVSNPLPLSAFNAEFHVNRNGICEIIVPQPMTHHANAPTFPGGQSGQHIEHILTAPDTIVDLWEDNPSDPFDWKLQTLYALYRKVIAYKRIRHRQSFAASLGVAAYANTFREIIIKGATQQDITRIGLHPVWLTPS